MFFKILFVTSLITVCSGVSNPQKKSTRATYSQSFVREDVPLSYQYTAVHQYTPIRYVDSEEPEMEHNINKNEEPKNFNHKDIQYAPIPISRNHTYQTQSRRYTSITPNPVPEYENYEKPGHPAVKKDHLEPKPVPVYAKYTMDIIPTTYKPNVMDYNYKYFQSLPPDYYHAPINQVEATTETSKQELNELLKDFEIYQQAQQVQQPQQQANFVRHTSTDNSKNNYILHTRFSFLPKQEPLNAKPFNSNRVFSIQTIPRLAYQNNFKAKPENKGSRLGKYSNYSHYSRFPKSR